MKLYQHNEAWPLIKNAVITIGTFDGVHEGHRKILRMLKAEAAATGGESMIISFHPHPRSIVPKIATDIRLLTTIEERTRLIAAEGIDHLVVVPFTEAFSLLSAQHYVEEFLIGKFHPKTVIIGHDHRFGHRRLGDFHLLEAYRDQGAFELREIPAHIIEDMQVSSTRIRKFLLEGAIQQANRLLGYPYFFSGTIVHGNKLGRTLGYPTANIELDNKEKLVPADGIYAVRLRIEGDEKDYRGMMSIGIRPTIEDPRRVIEVNIFDFSSDIYDRKISVSLHSWLRSEQKFASLDELKAQMHLDKIQTLQALPAIPNS